MHILVLEIALTGHHFGYLERIVSGYISASHLVTVGIPAKEMGHPRIQRLTEAYPDQLHIHRLEQQPNLDLGDHLLGNIGRELAIRWIFRRTYREVNAAQPVDYVFVPYLDYCLYAIGLFGSPFGNARWGGICMRPSFHYRHYGVRAPTPKLAKLKRMLFIRLLKSQTLNKLLTIDELLSRYVDELDAGVTGKLGYVADPAELVGPYTRESARLVLNLPSSGKVMLVYGTMDGRKGIDLLVQATKNLREDVDDLHLLVVGKQSPEIRSFLQSEAASLICEKRCHTIDRFVTDEEQQMVFAACDWVWLGYQDHFVMSGVLVLAGIAGRPVLATRNGLIGWYAESMDFSLSVDTTDMAAVCTALRSLVQAADQSDIDRYGIRKKFNAHTWERLTQVVNDVALNK